MQQRKANAEKIPAEVIRENKKRQRLEIITVILVIVLAFSIFALVSAATDRLGLRADLTVNRLYEIGGTSAQVLEGLTETVTLTYCGSRGDGDSNITEVLDRYDKASDMIQVEYIDLESNPGFAENYMKQGITLSSDGVLVSCKGRNEFIEWTDLYAYESTTDSSGSQITSVSGLQAETKITGAIVKLLNSETPVAAFTAGHSEYVPQGLKDLLENSSYEVRQVVLGMDSLEGVSTVFIAGPDRDFSASEIQKLTDYMNEGGNLAVFLNPEREALPNLSAFLMEFGLETGDHIVLEPTQQMDSPLNIIPSFALSMISVYFSETSTYLVIPECRDLNLSSPNGWISAPVLKSTSSSYGKAVSEMTTLSKEPEDTAGPFTVAAVSEHTYTDAEGEAASQYVFLAATTRFYDDTYISMESIGNGDFILQLLSYMNDVSVNLNIPAKSLTVPDISISRGAVVLFAVIFALLIPVGLLAFGICVFLKRRHS